MLAQHFFEINALLGSQCNVTVYITAHSVTVNII